MSGDETQLTWELQDAVLLLDVSCVSMYLHTWVCVHSLHTCFFPLTDSEKCLKRRLVLVRKLRTVVSVKSR